jgi:DNA-binding NarL/FixJ family response regulator
MQMKILHGITSGQLNKQIAFDLGIAETTVKAHMTTIMRKLNVRNRTQVALVVQAMKLGGEAAVR